MPSGLPRQTQRRLWQIGFFTLFLLAPALDLFRFDLNQTQLYVLGMKWHLGIDALMQGKATPAETAAQLFFKGLLPIVLFVVGGLTVAWKYGRLYCGWLCPHFSIVEMLNGAVVVDGVATVDHGQTRVAPRATDEVDRLRALVRGAVGANDDRGDVVTVTSMPFRETLDAPAASRAARTVARPPASKRLYVLGAVSVALVLLIVAVAAIRRRKQPGELATTPATVVAVETPEEEPMPLDPELVRERLRAEVHARVLADPATAALVLRAWLGTETPDRPRAS